MKLTKQTTMGEMLEYDMGIAYILMQCGMHCVGCPSSIGESLEEAREDFLPHCRLPILRIHRA